MLQRRWDAFYQQLYLLCYVMHPAKLFSGLNEAARPLFGVNLASLAADTYEQCWGADSDARSRISAQARIQNPEGYPNVSTDARGA